MQISKGKNEVLVNRHFKNDGYQGGCFFDFGKGLSWKDFGPLNSFKKVYEITLK